MRDIWYGICSGKYGASSLQVYEELNQLGETLQVVRKDQLKYQTAMNKIKTTLVGSLNATGDAIDKTETMQQVVATSGFLTSG